jgi:hypothetical protein
MASYMDTIYNKYIYITSKNHIENKMKTKTKDVLLVYCYKCKIKSFKDVIDASRIMLLNNIKILKTINNSNINEWQFYSFSTIDDLKILFKKNNETSNFDLIINSLNYNDD